jgi:hypothetical protein
VPTVVGDNFAAEFSAEPFKRRGIAYQRAAKPKSDLYLAFLPLLNSCRVELLDSCRSCSISSECPTPSGRVRYSIPKRGSGASSI